VCSQVTIPKNGYGQGVCVGIVKWGRWMTRTALNAIWKAPYGPLVKNFPEPVTGSVPQLLIGSSGSPYCMRKNTEPDWSTPAFVWVKLCALLVEDVIYPNFLVKQSTSKHDVWVKSLSLTFHFDTETQNLLVMYPFSYYVKHIMLNILG
jgi:hypothetical protein